MNRISWLLFLLFIGGRLQHPNRSISVLLIAYSWQLEILLTALPLYQNAILSLFVTQLLETIALENGEWDNFEDKTSQH